MSPKGATPPRPGLLEVGRVIKPHGLNGEVSVQMISDRPERVAVGAEFVLVGPSGAEADAGGRAVAVKVVGSRRHQQRWLLRFEGCSSKEAAQQYRGHTLWAESIDDPDVLWVHELIGCRVSDHKGVERGEVVSVHENPASDLLELSTGHLVPVTFVVDGPSDGRVVVEVPDGLFDL